MAYGSYISQSATRKNKGRYNGYSFAFVTASMLFGNMLAAVLITRVKYSTFFLTVPGISLIAAFYFLGVKNPEPPLDLDEIQSTEPQKESLRDVIKLMVSKRMLLISCTITAQFSLSLGFWANLFMVWITSTMRDTGWTEIEKNS